MLHELSLRLEMPRTWQIEAERHHRRAPGNEPLLAKSYQGPGVGLVSDAPPRQSLSVAGQFQRRKDARSLKKGGDWRGRPLNSALRPNQHRPRSTVSGFANL